MQLEDFIRAMRAIEEDKEVVIPYNLHNFIRGMIDKFGSAKAVADNLGKMLEAEPPKITNAEEAGQHLR